MTEATEKPHINGKNARRGQRLEQSAKKQLQALGFPACRTTVMSGSLSWLGVPELVGDIKAGWLIHGPGGREATIQCKQRKTGTGFATLYKWLAEPHMDILWLKKDRAAEAIVAMPASVFAYLLSNIPKEHRLEPPKDRWLALRQAAATNEYAAAALRRIEEHRKPDDDEDTEPPLLGESAEPAAPLEAASEQTPF